MIKTLVTGASGFIGKNLCLQLEQDEDIEVVRFTRGNNQEELEKMIVEADFIFHLAGVNRPDDENVFDLGNRGLTQQITDLLEKHDKKTPLLLTSSIQAAQDNPYGKSKSAAEEIVRSWQRNSGAQVFIYRLPNVFGKWCRPNYNSVVATFCNNIAKGLDIKINDPSVRLNLTYIDDVVSWFIRNLRGDTENKEQDGYFTITPTHSLTLQELADKLYMFHEMRKTSVVPELLNPIDRNLYATYTSYLSEDSFSYPLDMKRDDRGWLAEFIKSKSFGQVFISKTKPGISRGKHWHHTKIEKFLVIEGKGEIKFRLPGNDKVISYSVNGDELTVVDIPAGYIHSITNVGEGDLLTLFWADEILNPDKPDTYYAEVEQ